MNVVGLLRKKALRRIALLTVLVAPIIYLFGTQIAGLAGAHGEEVFAEPVYVQGEVVSNSFNSNTNKMELDTLDNKNAWLDYVFGATSNPSGLSCTFNGLIGQFTYGVWSSTEKTLLFKVTSSGNYNPVARLQNGVRTINDNTPTWSFEASNTRLNTLRYGYDGFKYYEPALVASDSVESNSIAYTDYLFGNMFGKSNFLTEWGHSAIDNSAGLPPVNQLLKFIAEDGLNIADSNIGLMGIGYATYLLHAIMIYEFVALAIELLTIPLKIGDWFTKGVNKE